MEPGGAKYIVQEPEWENDTTVFCNEFMRKLESSYSTRVLFRIFKPFIRGKLIYTPDAPVINRIMARINKVLSQVKMIIDLIKNSNEGPAEFNNLKFEDLVNKFKNEESFLLVNLNFKNLIS